jgi:hypothetical protein
MIGEKDQDCLRDRIELFKVLGKMASGYSDLLTHSITGKKVEVLMSFNISQEEWDKAMTKHLVNIEKKKTKPSCQLVIDDKGNVEGAGSSDSPFPAEETVVVKKGRPARIQMEIGK